ncbi:MAG: STAS domain-containing protein [Burkholderiales bacterium]|nr:STAS domain-containing protein [Burkholderiales bacterium]
MVFSFFRKKDSPTPASAKRKPATSKAAPKTIAPPVGGIAPKVAVPQARKASLAPEAAGAAAKKIAPKVAPKAQPQTSPKKQTLSESGFEVSDSPAELSGAAEEAAILYANNQIQPAIAVLLQGVGEKLGSSNRSLWLMLFDLYQLQGMQQEFDDLALDFVVKFERSPPPWRNREKAKAAPKATKPAAAGTASLSGTLTAACKPQLEQLVRTIDSKNQARLDLSKIDGITTEGSALLRETLQNLRKRGAPLSLAGADHLAQVALDALPTAHGNEKTAPCLLLLELYQILGKQAEFDDLAVQYAVETEVSPPSWETAPHWGDEAASQPKPEVEGAQERAAAPGSRFALTGEMAGSTEPQLRDFVDYAASRIAIEVDMLDLRRMDFVCCGMLLNILTGIRQGGKGVRLIGANEMVFALCRVMGIDQVATLVKSKHH